MGMCRLKECGHRIHDDANSQDATRQVSEQLSHPTNEAQPIRVATLRATSGQQWHRLKTATAMNNSHKFSVLLNAAGFRASVQVCASQLIKS
jgi:hypothetical protein